MSGAQRDHLISVDAIGDMLRARIHDLCIGPWGLRGTIDGNNFVACNPLRHDRKPGSFRVCVRGAYQGLVKDFASNETWSPMSFSAALLHRGDMGATLRWARAWLGLDGCNPDALRVTRAALARAGDDGKEDAEAAARAEETRRRAHARWLAGVAITDTPVDAYLLARGIDIRRFDRPLNALRFHPAVWCAEVSERLPAMVAGVVGADGRFLSVHRTWLAQIGGVWTKAALERPKKVMGRCGGGMIRLWGGTRVDPKTGEVKPGRKLGVAKVNTEEINLTEGIENALSLAVGCQDLRVAAAGNVENLGKVIFPASVAAVTLWRDNDKPSSAADLAFARNCERLTVQGSVLVRVACPPAQFKDLNDWLLDKPMREAAHG